MRNAMSKDFFREIKYTLNRYVSILLIVALGVAFLAGIRATCPDMKLSLDYYLDQSDFMDLRVLSTLGRRECQMDTAFFVGAAEREQDQPRGRTGY